MKRLLSLSLLAMVLSVMVNSPLLAIRTNEVSVVVPEHMDYCGMQLRFTKKGRARIQNYVNKYVGNYTYYKIMADRAATYMPFIEDAFSLMGVPKDLMYIAIQESALRGGAVSPSNAVGFWQFKDFTAREVGLTVDRNIDERKHIFRASVGAAKYFKANYKRYDNWVYAVISYMTGGTGAKPYTDEKYIGAQEMVIDENLHWYAAKAIAHRIAYAPAIDDVEKPKVRLYPLSNKGEVDVKEIAKQHNVRFEDLKKHNLWILDSKLPTGEPFSYYIEQAVKDDRMALLDPHRTLFEPDGGVPEYLLAVHKKQQKEKAIMAEAEAEVQKHRALGEALAKPVEPPPSRRYTLPPSLTNVRQHPIVKDPYYGVEFVRVERGQTLYSLAKTYNQKVDDLQRWNHLGPRDPLPEGYILSLVPPRDANVHIARKWETITDVALRYGRNPKRLLRRNRLDEEGELLVEGQRILLQNKLEKGDPTVVYHYEPQPKKQFATKSEADAKQLETSVINEDARTASGASQALKPDREKAITFPPKNPETNSQSMQKQIVSAEQPKRDSAEKTDELQGDISGRDTPIDGAKYHYVQPGETLWRIALKYKVPVDTLKDLNTLKGDDIRAGQRIRVQ